MREHNQTPVYIIALNYADAEKERAALNIILGAGKYKPVTGSWEGVEEPAYIVPSAVFAANRQQLTQALRDQEQDCILFLDNQRNAFLCFPGEDGQYQNHVYQGEYKQVPEATARAAAGYTQDGGTFYTIIGGA